MATTEWVPAEAYETLKREHRDLQVLFWTAVWSQPDHKLVTNFPLFSYDRMELGREDIFDRDAALWTAALKP